MCLRHFLERGNRLRHFLGVRADVSKLGDSLGLMSALFNAFDKHTHHHAKHSTQRSPSQTNRYRQSNAFSNRSYSPSPSSSEISLSFLSQNPLVLGVCAMDVKTRSKPMREILTRIADRARGYIDIRIFGDKVILDEGTAIRSFLLPSNRFHPQM